MNRLVRAVPRLVALVGIMVVGVMSPAYALPVAGSNDTGSGDRVPYLISLVDEPLASYRGGVPGLKPTSAYERRERRLDVDSSASQAYLRYLKGKHDAAVTAVETVLGREVTPKFSYRYATNGFAVEVTEAEAAKVVRTPGVAGKERGHQLKLLTDAGPAWIGAPQVWEGAPGGTAGTQGEGVVVGIIDTGINYDHPSFADVGGDGYNHDNPRGQFYGLCAASTGALAGAPFCNDKLIGVWDFTGTTPVDHHGHGSHTASTTAGNVQDATVKTPTMSMTAGVSGVAPHANIISYKVCVEGCLNIATVAAIDQAVADGVDVINFSIGGPAGDPWSDGNAQAFLRAREAGIFVATSAGNSGPEAATIGSPADAPWLLTVGASTHDRAYRNSLTDLSGGTTTPPAELVGASFTSGHGPAPVVYAGSVSVGTVNSGNAKCTAPFPPGTFDGEIVICDRGENARVEKGRNVKLGGAGGMVLVNLAADGESTVADAHELPAVHLGATDGAKLKKWVNSGSSHTATIAGTVADKRPANGDVMAGFSSRGVNPSAPGVIKPDVTAPGVDILAAVNKTDATAGPAYGLMSGTSMSSPHAAGAAALLSAVRPDWTPAQLQSALTTTGIGSWHGTAGVRKDDGTTAADPFDMGGGRIDVARAAAAGLVLDVAPGAYAAADPTAGGDPTTLNLATLGQTGCRTTCTWTRVVTNTTDASATWTAAGSGPSGMTVTVSPSEFTLAAGESAALTITANVSGVSTAGWTFGQVQLTSSSGSVPATRLPVAVQVDKNAANVEPVTLHFRGNQGDEFGCTGDGRMDLEECGGPFLVTDGNLSNEIAARWTDTSAVGGTAARTPYTANWEWKVDQPTTLEGGMTLGWWASCEACSAAFYDDWEITLWADGKKVFGETVRTNIPLPVVPERLTASVDLPQVSAGTSFVLAIQPVFVNQAVTTIYYDSTQPCPGASQGPCDSTVRMPVMAG